MLSKRLKDLRKEAGWSQQKLAEKAGLSFNVITKIEQGAAKSPSIHTIIKLADALSISIDDLLGRVDKEYEKRE
ncbi:MAG: helix-turn-helix transcriptional regulator [Candidatus Omnitrophica bacterium]|nr:helix-turn-helix transcriptional regulator [Candidatus Omnitrophota bacterium]